MRGIWGILNSLMRDDGGKEATTTAGGEDVVMS